MHSHALVAAIHEPCTAIGKNFKSVNPAKQFQPHIPCVEPNHEIQTDFGGPFF